MRRLELPADDNQIHTMLSLETNRPGDARSGYLLNLNRGIPYNH